jgi:molecular chaperone DnaK (HSP70)
MLMRKSKTFSTYTDNLVCSSRSSRVSVLAPKTTTSSASSNSGIPPTPCGIPQIEVTFDIHQQ